MTPFAKRFLFCRLCNYCTKTARDEDVTVKKERTASTASQEISRPSTPSSENNGSLNEAPINSKLKRLRKRSMSRKSSASSEVGHVVDKDKEKDKEQTKEKDKVQTKDKEKVEDKVPATGNQTKVEDIADDVKGEFNVKTPFEELIHAASIMNPRVFELPREMNIFTQFPGDDRSKFPLIGSRV